MFCSSPFFLFVVFLIVLFAWNVQTFFCRLEQRDLYEATCVFWNICDNVESCIGMSCLCYMMQSASQINMDKQDPTYWWRHALCYSISFIHSLVNPNAAGNSIHSISAKLNAHICLIILLKLMSLSRRHFITSPMHSVLRFSHFCIRFFFVSFLYSFILHFN